MSQESSKSYNTIGMFLMTVLTQATFVGILVVMCILLAQIMLDTFYKAQMNFFVSSDPKWDPDRVTCEIDGENVDMKECDGIDHFIEKIESQGYKYDSGNGWWSRTWTTESEPKESIEEVYQQLENGGWNQLMIGYGDRIFYEEKVRDPS